MNDVTRGFVQAWQLVVTLDPDFVEIVLLSLVVSGLAVLLGTALGVPTGALLGLYSFPGKRLVQVVVGTLMGLPPVVLGLVAYLALSRSGPLGALGWLFTPRAMVLAQFILVTPIIAGLSAAAVAGVEGNVRLTALGLGANRRQVLATMILEARFAVMAAVAAGLGRALAEVGAVMMVGGNILHETRVMTTAIVLATGEGRFDLAIALGLVLLGVAFVLNAGIAVLQRAGGGGRA